MNCRKYLVEYYHNGARWGITIDAESMEDASARVRQLQYAKLLGSLEMEIPATLGWFARAVCWFRNSLVPLISGPAPNTE